MTYVLLHDAAQKKKERNKYIPTTERLQQIVRTGRQEGKPYIYEYNSDSEVRRNFKTKVESLGYTYVEYDRSALAFLPKSEVAGYEVEDLFVKSGVGGKYAYNKYVRAADFKSQGSAWIADLHAGGYHYRSDNIDFIKADKIYWTGSVTNSKINGRGDGCVVVGKDTYALSGEFKAGQIVDAYICKNKDKRIYHVKFYPRADGYAAYDLDEVGSNVSSSGFVNSNYEVQKGKYAHLRPGRNGNYIVSLMENYILFPPDPIDVVLSKDMHTIIVPDTIKEIPKGFFSHNPDLYKVVLPKSVTNIEKGAFYECYNLKEVTFASTYVIIGEMAFFHCASLKSISLPSVSIYDYAFNKCSNLESVSCKNNPSTGWGIFKDTKVTKMALVRNGKTVRESRDKWFRDEPVAAPESKEGYAYLDERNSKSPSGDLKDTRALRVFSDADYKYENDGVLENKAHNERCVYNVLFDSSKRFKYVYIVNCSSKFNDFIHNQSKFKSESELKAAFIKFLKR